MAADAETTGWIPQIVAALGLATTGFGAWVVKVSTRQARYEQKLEDFAEHTSGRLDSIDDGIQRIKAHITGTDL